MGIEPTALAWEARVLPLYDVREGRDSTIDFTIQQTTASHDFRHWFDSATSTVETVS